MTSERLPLLPSEDAKGPLGGAKRWIKDAIREANTVMQSLMAFSTLLASINPMLAILIHGHAGIIVKLVVSIIGSALAVSSMMILLAQKIVSVLDGAGGLGAISLSSGEEVESALVKEVEITEGTVLERSSEGAWEDLGNLRNDLNTLQESFHQQSSSGGDTRASINKSTSSSSDTTKVGAEL